MLVSLTAPTLAGEDQDDPSDSEGNPPPAEPVPGVVYCEAMKQLLVERPPTVLNLHLKRFLQHGRHLRKNTKHISFPTQLDLSPFCTPACRVSMSHSHATSPTLAPILG